MPLASVTTFTKLMMLTTSTNDHEALSALRKANEMLSQSGNNWEEFIEGKVDVELNSGQSVPPVHGGLVHDDPAVINPMFDSVLGSLRSGSFKTFVTSLHEQWEDRQFLSAKQFAALQTAFRKV